MLQRGAEYIARFFVAQGKSGCGTRVGPISLAKNNLLALKIEFLLVCFSIGVIVFGVLLRFTAFMFFLMCPNVPISAIAMEDGRVDLTL